MSVRPTDISQALLDVNPRIVHFSGHGESTGAIYLEDKTGKRHPVEPQALAALFEQFTGQVECVVLNACYSEQQARAIGRHIDWVIGMDQSISDKAAIAFSIGFYQALGAGRSILDAYKLGRVQIGLDEATEHLVPILIQKNELANLMSDDVLERKAVYSGLSQDESTTKEYCLEAIDVPVFYGRNKEIGTLKKWILRERCRLLAILGIGGIGKSSLAVKLIEHIKEHYEYFFGVI